MKKIQLIIAAVFLMATFVAVSAEQMPPFLSKYYSPIFEGMTFIAKSTGNNAEQFVYESSDLSLTLNVEYIKGDRPGSKAMLNNITHYFNNGLKSKKGAFKVVNEKEVYLELQENELEKFIYAFDTGEGVQIWTYGTKQKKAEWIKNNFKNIRALTNRLRYENALAEGNVSMGHWGPEIYEYASLLFEKAKPEEGLDVLKKLLYTSPFNFRAHADFIEKTKNKEDAINSARIILKNAEDGALINSAAAYLGDKTRTLESIPVLDERETGLQLVLIPLPPCNPRLLEESAKIYEKITGIPVKIRRLKETWSFGVPERIPHQRFTQNILIKQKKANIDFQGWSKQDYIEALLRVAGSEDALSNYHINKLVEKIEGEPGQYFVNTYLNRFLRILDNYRGSDNRTMYVGVTEVNIYSGDNNYIFSLYGEQNKANASILSYYMMMAKNLSEEYESRNRLNERIAKELVPASLKSLKIPRSTDPTCPYSYSSGVPRLDQKTLVLSEPVMKELERIKTQQGNTQSQQETAPALW